MDVPLRPPGTGRSVAAGAGLTSTLQRRFPHIRFIPVIFDGVGAELVPGDDSVVDVPVHFDGIILRWRLLAIQSGDLQIDVWKTDYASFPPTVADTITGSDTPALVGTDHDESAALTGWTTEVSNGDTLRFHIDSVSGITRATLTLAIAA